jgi:hypothetical protein
MNGIGHVIAISAALLIAGPVAAQTFSHFPDLLFHDGVEGVTAGPFNDADAARFLSQATLGPTLSDIDHLRSLTNTTAGAGYQAWLDEQFVAQPTLMLDYYNWVTEPPGYKTIIEGWLRSALGGPDSLNNANTNTDHIGTIFPNLNNFSTSIAYDPTNGYMKFLTQCGRR